jgi:hypothetical protein
MLLLLLILFFVSALRAQEEIPAMIFGVYGHPGPISEKDLRLD